MQVVELLEPLSTQVYSLFRLKGFTLGDRHDQITQAIIIGLKRLHQFFDRESIFEDQRSPHAVTQQLGDQRSRKSFFLVFQQVSLETFNSIYSGPIRQNRLIVNNNFFRFPIHTLIDETSPKTDRIE